MPVLVKKKYVIRDKVAPSSSRMIEANSLEDAALKFAANLGYDIFEDVDLDVEDVNFMMIDTKPQVPFNMKKNILEAVYRGSKKPLICLPAPKSVATDTALCVKGTCGDGNVEPLGDAFMGKAHAWPST